MWVFSHLRPFGLMVVHREAPGCPGTAHPGPPANDPTPTVGCVLRLRPLSQNSRCHHGPGGPLGQCPVDRQGNGDRRPHPLRDGDDNLTNVEVGTEVTTSLKNPHKNTTKQTKKTEYN